MSATDPPGGESSEGSGEPRQGRPRQNRPRQDEPRLDGPRLDGENPGELSEDRVHRRVAKPGPWRVFLSHTSELGQHPGPGQSYVDRAERAVSAAGHAISDMADFASTDQDPASLCADKVGECDV